MKQQVIVIHGGDTFESYDEYLNFLRGYKIDFEKYKTGKGDWKLWLREKLGDDFEVILPIMPNKSNARFEEWKIWFEKLLPFLHEEVVLVGHSLGGAFLAKYLSENTFPKKIKALFLVSAVYDKDADGYPLLSFRLPDRLNLQTEKIYLYHSSDDPVVPLDAYKKYQKALPTAQVQLFKDRQHFQQEQFPELLDDIIHGIH